VNWLHPCRKFNWHNRCHSSNHTHSGVGNAPSSGSLGGCPRLGEVPRACSRLHFVFHLLILGSSSFPLPLELTNCGVLGRHILEWRRDVGCETQGTNLDSILTQLAPAPPLGYRQLQPSNTPSARRSSDGRVNCLGRKMGESVYPKRGRVKGTV
jgi:hypothetical protein